MNKKGLTLALLTAGVLAGSTVVPSFAEANHYGRDSNYSRDYGRWSEVRRDRRELWRDQAELARDREDLRRLYQRGASRAAIERKREEIRDDLREIRESSNELRGDRRYGYDRRYDRGWWGHGWWNRNR